MRRIFLLTLLAAAAIPVAWLTGQSPDTRPDTRRSNPSQPSYPAQALDQFQSRDNNPAPNAPPMATTRIYPGAIAEAGRTLPFAPAQAVQTLSDPHEQAARQLAQKYRFTQEANEKTAIRTELVALTKRAFTERLEARRKQIADARAELDRIEAHLEQRQKLEKEIIDRRVAQLLDEPDVLDWNSPMDSSGPNLGNPIFSNGGIYQQFYSQGLPAGFAALPPGNASLSTQPLPTEIRYFDSTQRPNSLLPPTPSAPQAPARFEPATPSTPSSAPPLFPDSTPQASKAAESTDTAQQPQQE